MHVELEVTLCRRSGNVRLGYRLRSEELDESFESPILLTEPGVFLRRLHSLVENSHRGVGPGGELALIEDFVRRLRTLGQDLYLDLLPRSLRRRWWQLRDDVATLWIRSQEPWIPWEVLAPVDRRSGTAGDHLAATCGLLRWPLVGLDPPPRPLRPRSILFIDAAAGGQGPVLAAAADERACLAALAERLGVAHIELDHPTVDEVAAAITDGRPGIVHASAHGLFAAAAPDESVLALGARRPFRPSDLAGDLRQALRRDRPLVFLNACQLGRQGWSLTGLGGWAERLLASGAGAFLAPAWTVRDRAASRFATVFYRHLGDGTNLGVAARAARKAARDERHDPSTWLAYQVCGHPAASLAVKAGGPRP